MSKPCPRCDLVHPDYAQRCECGYDFSTGQQPSGTAPQRLLWYQESWALIVLLLVCSPIGLILVWDHPTLSRSWKWRITIIWAVLAATSAWLKLQAASTPRLQP